MSEPTYADWALLILWFTVMCAFVYFLGTLVTQAIVRHKIREEKASYKDWGLYDHLIRFDKKGGLTGLGIFTAVLAALLFWASFLSISTITEDNIFGFTHFYFTLTIALYPFFIGNILERERADNIIKIVHELNSLNPVFYQRFPASELLSMYEALRHAPRLFWKEYIYLPYEEVTLETNRIFRERAAPYSQNRFSRYNRITIVVTALGLLLAVILAAWDQFIAGQFSIS